MKTKDKLLKKLLYARKNKKILLTSKYYSPANSADRFDALYIFDAYSRKIIDANDIFSKCCNMSLKIYPIYI